MKTSNIVLATGIVGGLLSIYAIRNNYTNEEIKEKSIKMKNELDIIIDDLAALSLDILGRIYSLINEIVKITIYRVEGLLHKLDVEIL